MFLTLRDLIWKQKNLYQNERYNHIEHARGSMPIAVKVGDEIRYASASEIRPHPQTGEPVLLIDTNP